MLEDPKKSVKTGVAMTNILCLLGLLFSAAAAFAQSKVWTWESPLKGDETAISCLNASGVDPKGYAVLVLGERKEVENVALISRHRLVWISPTGSVLHEEEIDRPEESYFATVDWAGSWEVLFVSSKGFGVTDGKEIWTVKRKGKAFIRTHLSGEDLEGIAKAGSATGYDGWLQTGVRTIAVFPSVGEVLIRMAPSVSLWSAR
jgi:hypothetical protein